MEPAQALELKKKLAGGIKAVGVFIDEAPEEIAKIVKSGAIDMVQLHGSEDNAYISELRTLLESGYGATEDSFEDKTAERSFTDGKRTCRDEGKSMEPILENCRVPVIQAFLVRTTEDLRRAESSDADYLLLDSGTGTGKTFDWSILEHAGGMNRPFFLAGGLDPDNLEAAMERIQPFAVDMSSGVETDGVKDGEKIAAAVRAVRGRKE